MNRKKSRVFLGFLDMTHTGAKGNRYKNAKKVGNYKKNKNNC